MLKRLEIILLINDIDVVSKQRAILLNGIGTSTSHLIKH